MSEIPSFSIATILESRDRLVSMNRALVGKRLVGEHFRKFIDGIRPALSGVRKPVLVDSAGSLRNHILTDASLRAFCWRIAANRKKLQRGVPAHPWAGQVSDEWMPIQLIRHELWRSYRGDIRHRFTYNILAGSAAGLASSCLWSRKQCPFIARRLGFTPIFGKLPYSDPAQMVNLRLVAMFTPNRSNDRPGFHEVFCSASMLEWNRGVIRARLKINPPCPRGYHHPCHQCVIGYEECPAATHLKTFYQELCLGCGLPNAVFDPESKAQHCIECERRIRLAPRKEQK